MMLPFLPLALTQGAKTQRGTNTAMLSIFHVALNNPYSTPGVVGSHFSGIHFCHYATENLKTQLQALDSSLGAKCIKGVEQVPGIA